jgi:hypothetical protein
MNLLSNDQGCVGPIVTLRENPLDSPVVPDSRPGPSLAAVRSTGSSCIQQFHGEFLVDFFLVAREEQDRQVGNSPPAVNAPRGARVGSDRCVDRNRPGISGFRRSRD